MGSDGPEGGNAPGFRPTISFSRCRPPKQKVRSDKATTSKSSGKQASKTVSKKPTKSKPRRKSYSKPLPAVLSQQSDNKLEKLAKKVLNKPRRHSAAAETTTRKVGRPPIPSFLWSDDDDDDIPGPVFSKKKDTSSAGTSQSNVVQVADESNSDKLKDHTKLKSAEANGNNDSKSSTVSKGGEADIEKAIVSRQSSLESASTYPSQQQSSTSADRKAQPTNEELNQVIDRLYQEVSDPTTLTVKQFHVHVQTKFRAILSVATKKYIKKRVTDLINGEIVATNCPPKDATEVEAVPNEKHTSQNNGNSRPGSSISATVGSCREQSAHADKEIERDTSMESTNRPCILGISDNKKLSKEKEAVSQQSLPDPSLLKSNTRLPPSRASRDGTAHTSKEATTLLAQEQSTAEGKTELQKCLALESKPNESLGARSKDCSGPSNDAPPIPSHVSLPLPKTEKTLREQSTQTEQELRSNQRSSRTDPAKTSQKIEKLYPKKPVAARATQGEAKGCKLCNKCPCKVTNAPQKRSSKRGVDSLRDTPAANVDALNGQRDKYIKAAEDLEIQADRIRRDIKKRRREFLREEAKSLQLDNFQSGQYRFLPGGQEMEDQLDSFKSVPVPSEDVKNARTKLFGDSCQPTLTQMFGVSRETETKEAEGKTNVEASEHENAGCGSELEESNCDDIVVLQSNDEDSSVETTTGDYLDDSSMKDEPLSIQRVEWRNGSSSSNKPDGNTKNDRSIWGSLVASMLQRNADANYECGFRQVFSNESPATDDAQGLEHLLGLFGSAPSPQSSPTKANVGTLTPSSLSSSPPSVSSVLTQRGKMLAEKINGKATADSPRLAKVEAACPQWKENVAFAMRQRDPAEIQAALDNIRQSKARLQAMKEGFLRAYEEQQSAFSIFEDSLQESLGRFEKEGTPPLVEESDATQKVN